MELRRDHLPRGLSTGSPASTVEGVTDHLCPLRQRDVRLDLASSRREASRAREAARDAHDRRVGNVLYSGGAAEAAIAACLR
jgi:hypothetical protein